MSRDPNDRKRRQRRRIILTAAALFGFVLTVYLLFVARGVLGYL